MWNYQLLNTNEMNPSLAVYADSSDIPPDQYASRLRTGVVIQSSWQSGGDWITDDAVDPFTSTQNSSFKTAAGDWLNAIAIALNNGGSPVPRPVVAAGPVAFVNQNSDLLKGLLIAALAVAAIVAASKWL